MSLRADAERRNLVDDEEAARRAFIEYMRVSKDLADARAAGQVCARDDQMTEVQRRRMFIGMMNSLHNDRPLS